MSTIRCKVDVRKLFMDDHLYIEAEFIRVLLYEEEKDLRPVLSNGPDALVRVAVGHPNAPGLVRGEFEVAQGDDVYRTPLHYLVLLEESR